MSKFPIADRHNLYLDEIRTEERAMASDEISEVCRKYGIDDSEFPFIVELSRRELYDSTDLIQTDNDEEDEDNLDLE